MYMCVYMYVCMCMCVYVSACLFVCLSVCMYVSLCVCVCMYVYVSVCRLSPPTSALMPILAVRQFNSFFSSVFALSFTTHQTA